ncbi:tight adherence pilus pseudopilin TadF [Erysipelothrix piscisicarius]|uniref:tight adherence pilus pseudopilin TadF n=1 Tax=Erysipelothrix piscisicarius TaxID=2485784 RepID=UPI002F94D53B
MVNFKNEEDGNILIMFAFILMFLLGFVALSTDVVLAMNKKDKLTEVAYLVREARLDITEEMLHSQQGQQNCIG